MTMRITISLVLSLGLAGCGQVPPFLAGAPDAEPEVAAEPPPPPPEEISEVVGAPPPPAEAVTAAEFDTTSEAQKEAARDAAEAAEAQGGGTRLGTTVVSLGDPTEPGIWIKTPLARENGAGRVEAADGTSAVVQLIPLDGPETAGSQMSIAAFTALGLSLTDLPTVTVYGG